MRQQRQTRDSGQNERERLLKLLEGQNQKYGSSFKRFQLSSLTENKWLIINLKEATFEFLFKKRGNNVRPNSPPDKDKTIEVAFKDMATMDYPKDFDLLGYGLNLKGRMGVVNSISNEAIEQWEDINLKFPKWRFEQFVDCIRDEGADVCIFLEGEKRAVESNPGIKYETAKVLMVRSASITSMVNNLPVVFPQ